VNKWSKLASFFLFLPAAVICIYLLTTQTFAQGVACPRPINDADRATHACRNSTPGFSVSDCFRFSNGCEGTACPAGFTYVQFGQSVPSCPGGQKSQTATALNSCTGYYVQDGLFRAHRLESGSSYLCFPNLNQLPDCENRGICYRCVDDCEDTYMDERVCDRDKGCTCPTGQHEVQIPEPFSRGGRCFQCEPQIPAFACHPDCDGRDQRFESEERCRTAIPPDASGRHMRCGVEACKTSNTPYIGNACRGAGTPFFYCKPDASDPTKGTVEQTGNHASLNACTTFIRSFYPNARCRLTSTEAGNDPPCVGRFWVCRPPNPANPNAIRVVQTTNTYANIGDCNNNETPRHANTPCFNTPEAAEAVCNPTLFYCRPDGSCQVASTREFPHISACSASLTARYRQNVICHANQAAAAADPNCQCGGDNTPCTCPVGTRIIGTETAARNFAATQCRNRIPAQILSTFVPASCPTGAVRPNPPHWCYTCVADCRCEDFGLFGTAAVARNARCPGNPSACTTYTTRRNCDNGKRLICWDATIIQRCEPQVTAETRIFGYVVSDPDKVAHLIPGATGSFCAAPGRNIGNVGSATDGSLSPTGARFEVSIIPPGNTYQGSRSNDVQRNQNVIGAVGSFRFNNLPWNTDTYDVHLNIVNERDTAAALADGQEAVWICNCPVYNNDPFSCFYTNVPAPSPSNNCIGGVNNNLYGQFTSGNDDETSNDGDKITNLIRNNTCVNPNQNRTPNFFVTAFDVRNVPWWQSRGGMVFAQRSIVSRIPTQSNVHSSIIGDESNYNRCVPPHCAPYLIVQSCNSTGAPNQRKSASYPLLGHGGGTIDLRQTTGAASGTGNANTSNRTARATGNTSGQPIHYGQKEDFAYFRGLLPNINPLSVGVISQLSDLSSCGGSSGTTNLACIRNGNLRITDIANIVVPAGQKYTVFVDGDLNIGGDTNYGQSYEDNRSLQITVANGGYLAFIVSGDINIYPNVGYVNQNLTYNHSNQQFSLTTDSSFPLFDRVNGGGAGTSAIQCPSSTSGNTVAQRGIIQGVFIADGSINVLSNHGNGNPNPTGSGTIPPVRLAAVGSRQCGVNSRLPDKKFVSEGTFVGWSGVSLRRDFDDKCSFTKAWNAREATEVFNYRPDFLVNSPDWMWRSIRLRMESV